MKRNILTALTMISLAAAAGPALAANKAAHDHGAATTTLQLNAGKKWETDATLRKAIGDLRQSLAKNLDAIHKNRFPASGYGGLAHQVEGAVSVIIANCKLEPKADAQLHIIVADLLAGADQMASKAKGAKPKDGAIKVLGALDNYGKYFDDPGFQPITH